jgi:hypothetical protein
MRAERKGSEGRNPDGYSSHVLSPEDFVGLMSALLRSHVTAAASASRHPKITILVISSKINLLWCFLRWHTGPIRSTEVIHLRGRGHACT